MHIVSGSHQELSKDFRSKVASYRHSVFVKRLGWQLETQNDQELDQFDRPDTVYVAAKNDEGRILGCARLLPTTRPYLLGEVFPSLLDGSPVPSSSEVWELSRFAAVDVDRDASRESGQFSSPVAVKLLKEAMACAISHGARQLITVSPIGVERLLRKAGFDVSRAGPPMEIDGHRIFACLITPNGASTPTKLSPYQEEFHSHIVDSRPIPKRESADIARPASARNYH